MSTNFDISSGIPGCIRPYNSPLLVGPIEEKYDARPPVSVFVKGAGLKLNVTVAPELDEICDKSCEF